MIHTQTNERHKKIYKEDLLLISFTIYLTTRTECDGCSQRRC